MKNRPRLAAALLALALLLSLCACGATEPKPEPVPTPPSPYLPYLGAYTLFGVRHGDVIVDPAAMEVEIRSVLTLQDGGMGTLSINEDSGRIGSWTIAGERITLNPDSSPMTGFYRDGVIILTMDDGSTLYYASESADRSGYPIIGQEEYSAILAAEALAEAEREAERLADAEKNITIPGLYFIYAVEEEGLYLGVPDFGSNENMSILLETNGRGKIRVEDNTYSFKWKYEEGALSFEDAAGNFSDFSPALRRNGLFSLTLEVAGERCTLLYARADAYLTDIRTLTQAELDQILAERAKQAAAPAEAEG